MLTNTFSSVHVIDLPVFKPNDYLWEHHLKDGEEKWECYCRIIRELMAKEGQLVLSDSQMEEKYDYKALVYKTAKSAD